MSLFLILLLSLRALPLFAMMSYTQKTTTYTQNNYAYTQRTPLTLKRALRTFQIVFVVDSFWRAFVLCFVCHDVIHSKEEDIL